MRKVNFLIITTLLSIRLLAQQDGILFTAANCDELFDLSKANGKGSMIYFFEEGNSGCDEMESKVFTDASVQRFLTENFVSIRINKSEPVSAEMIAKAKIQFFPAILFFDEQGVLTFKVLGFCSAEELVSSAKRGLGREPLLNWYKKEYEAGTREKLFLYQMCYAMRDAGELTPALVKECLPQYTYDELRDPLLVDFIFEFSEVDKVTTFSSKDLAFLLMQKERPLFSDHLPLDQVEARMVYILQQDMEVALMANNIAEFSKAYVAMNEFRDKPTYEFKKMDGRTTLILTVDQDEEDPEKAFKKAIKILEKQQVP
jgi:thioredoxin-related protein